MSAQAARAPRPAPSPRPAPRPAARAAAPELAVVRGLVPHRSTLPTVALVVAILLTALGASLVLNALMATTAVKLAATRSEIAEVTDSTAVARSQLDTLSSADSLSARATALGMVPAGVPGVVDLQGSALTGGAPARG